MFNRLYVWSMSVSPVLWESIGILAFAILITFLVGVN